MSTERALNELDDIRRTISVLERLVIDAAEAGLGTTPLVTGESAGRSSTYSDPTASIALNARLAASRKAHKYALRAIHAAAVATAAAVASLNSAFRAADAPITPHEERRHLNDKERLARAELVELNDRANTAQAKRARELAGE